MQLDFRPALGETVHSVVSDLSPQVWVLFSVRLSSTQYHGLVDEGARVEVWSDLPALGLGPLCNVGGDDDGAQSQNLVRQWGSLAFSEEQDRGSKAGLGNATYFVDLASQSSQNTKIAQAGPIPTPASAHDDHDDHHDPNDNVMLTARTYIPTPPFDNPLHISFTYRVVYPSGYIRWLGNFGQNGHLDIRSLKDTIPKVRFSSAWRVDDASTITQERVQEGTSSPTVRWDVNQLQARGSDATEGVCVAHIEDMNDYLIWSMGTESIFQVHPPRDDPVEENDDVKDSDVSSDVVETASSILVFVPDPRRRHASSPSFALACSPGSEIKLISSSPRGDGMKQIVVAASPRPGAGTGSDQVILDHDDPRRDTSAFISKLLSHSGLLDDWKVTSQDEQEGPKARAVIISNVIRQSKDRQQRLPIQVAVLPLLPSVTSKNLVTVDLGPVVEEMEVFNTTPKPDVALFTSDVPQNGFHVLVGTSDCADEQKSSPRLALAVHREGCLISFSPIHALEDGARRNMKLVIVSPFYPDTGEHKGDKALDSTLLTPPPSPHPPITLPAFSATIAPAGDDVVDSELLTVIDPSKQLPSESSTPLISESNSTPAPSSQPSKTSLAPPAPSSEKAVIPSAGPPKRRRLTFCPPFGGLFTLLRSIFLSVTTIFRLFYGVLNSPRQRLVPASLRIPIFGRDFGPWLADLGQRRNRGGGVREPREKGPKPQTDPQTPAEANLGENGDRTDVDMSHRGRAGESRNVLPNTDVLRSSGCNMATPDPSLRSFTPSGRPAGSGLMPDTGAGTENAGRDVAGTPIVSKKQEGNPAAGLPQDNHHHHCQQGPSQHQHPHQLTIRTRFATGSSGKVLAAIFQDQARDQVAPFGRNEEGEGRAGHDGRGHGSDGIESLPSESLPLFPIPNARILQRGFGRTTTSTPVPLPASLARNEVRLFKHPSMSSGFGGKRTTFSKCQLVEWHFRRDVGRVYRPSVDEKVIQIDLRPIA